MTEVNAKLKCTPRLKRMMFFRYRKAKSSHDIQLEIQNNENSEMDNSHFKSRINNGLWVFVIDLMNVIPK